MASLDVEGGWALLKKQRVTEIDQLSDAIGRVVDGGSVVDPDIVDSMVQRRSGPQSIRSLTDRERQVLALMAEGRTNQGIGERLFLGQKSIEAHVRSIFTKLGLQPAADDHRRVLAVLEFLRSS
jgi:serine/threonine-protein kinase